jgi:uncharacterized protein YodC (DUF2158 family)
MADVMGGFKKGDIVVLKSGGSLMTVHGPNECGGIVCVWEDKHGHRQEAVYDAETLQKGFHPSPVAGKPSPPSGLR